MANSKISALTAATTVAGTEVLPIVQSSATVKVAISNLNPGLSTILATKGGTGQTTYTIGDTLYASSTSALSKLGIGTADYVLTSSGSAPQWSVFLKATAGGTGQTSYAVGDILYASTTTALSKLADVATGNALISGGVSTAPSWGKIALTTHVSGVLPVANGGTNASTASITSFNNITGYTASGATGTTSTNLVFSTSPTLVTPTLGAALATSIKFGSGTVLSTYEANNWTPIDSSGAALVFTSAVGKYTKIGTAVFIQFKVTFPATVSGVAAIIGGLPFTVNNNDRDNIPVTILSDGTAVSGMVNQGGTTFNIFTIGTFTAVTNTTLTTKTLRGSGWYTAST